MDGCEPLLPDLPPALERSARRTYADPVLARRALFAPWPSQGFRSAYGERDLWREGVRLSKADADRRGEFERFLAVRLDALQSVAQPFFPAPGTEGTLRSPFPEVPDGDFWLFVTLWGTEETARRQMEQPISRIGGRTTAQIWADAQRRSAVAAQEQARRARGPSGPWQRLRERLGADPPDALPPDLRLSAWNYHVDQIAGNYR